MRSPYFDNARAILIYFVLLGHILSSYIMKNDSLESIYYLIYFFHMPAFIFISGYFSKSYQKKGYFKKLALKLLIPYLIFQTLYTLYYKFVLHQHISTTYFIPRWALWFLLSLFAWNVLLLLFAKWRYGFWCSLLLSLLVGYVSFVNDWLSLSRTVFFFPFFLLGHFTTETYLQRLQAIRYKLIAVFIFIVGYVLIDRYMNYSFFQWFLGKHSYDDLTNVFSSKDWIDRAFVYLFMFLAMFCFLSWVPKKQTWYTSIGKATLYIYLAHMFLLKIITETALSTYIVKHHVFLLLFLLPIIFIFLLTRKWVLSLLCPFIELKWKKRSNQTDKPTNKK